MKFALVLLALALVIPVRADDARDGARRAFLAEHCVECHDADAKKGELDLTALPSDLGRPDAFARWVKVYDRVREGQMPPKKRPRPPEGETRVVLDGLAKDLTAAALARRGGDGRATDRRLDRAEYQNTLRDLLALPGLDVMDLLPDDGSVGGFDKSAAALDVSHVQLAKYLEAATHALDVAVATRPQPPEVYAARMYAAESYDFKIVLTNGDAVLMNASHRPDTDVIPIVRDKLGKGLRELEQAGAFSHGDATAVFRHEDCAFRPRFDRFAPLYPGLYRFKVSLWSFVWDKGEVKPSPFTEAAWLKGGSRLLGYFDAPSLEPTVHEFVAWMNPSEYVTFNAASLKHVRVSERPGKAAEYVGPGIAIDWLDVEGPIEPRWPREGHRRLFGDLPIVAFDPKSGLEPPPRTPIRQTRPGAKPQPPRPQRGEPATYTVQAKEPEADARRLLKSFMDRAFRRPAPDAEVDRYLALYHQRVAQRATFEAAMRTAYEAVLCSPDFLYLRAELGALDDYALASRLSYFLWDSMPDDALVDLARQGKLHEPGELDRQVDRLLDDPKSDRFVEHFLDRWLNLKDIDATSPDAKLYPEFSPYLRDSMVRETRGYFRKMLREDLPVQDLVAGDFTLANAPLAKLYGLSGVDGSALREVKLPPACHRGGILTQASVLKATANGTVTSPVKRGAWVLDKILGAPPDPPPPSIPAIDPDVRGATTIRQQLDKHSADASCAACHAKIDPPGFALESFDVIGGWRERYRSVGEGDAVTLNGKPAPYKLALPVDCAGTTADGQAFANVDDFRRLLLANPDALAQALAAKLIAYATGAEVDFADRPTLATIVAGDRAANFGVRALIHAVVRSEAFLQK